MKKNGLAHLFLDANDRRYMMERNLSETEVSIPF